MFVSAFIPELPNQELKDPPDWIILDVSALLSFISVDTLLVKAFLILVVSLLLGICRNSSSSKFFLLNLNIIPVLFFAAEFL